MKPEKIGNEKGKHQPVTSGWSEACLARYLIVNADDFGLSRGVNAGIIQAHEQGIVTSASLRVRQEAAAAAAAYAREHSQLSVGLHVDLGEWKCVDGNWKMVYEIVPAEDPSAIAEEIDRQLEAFRDLMRREPTHLDSHQHVHRAEPVLSILSNAARSLGISLRGTDPPIRYVGKFYGQSTEGNHYPEGISVETLLEILHDLPPGFTELGCHPGADNDVTSVYGAEQTLECQALCDERVRAQSTRSQQNSEAGKPNEFAGFCGLAA